MSRNLFISQIWAKSSSQASCSKFSREKQANKQRGKKIEVFFRAEFCLFKQDCIQECWRRKSSWKATLSDHIVTCIASHYVVPQFLQSETSSLRIMVQSKSICSLIVSLAFITAQKHEEHLSRDYYDWRSSCAVPLPLCLMTSYEGLGFKMVTILECGL